MLVNNKQLDGVLNGDKTVNLNNTMTATEIQALIDAQPKNLSGYTLTFQFADGTYTLSTTLNFIGFVNGTMIVQGNTSEGTSIYSTQSVVLNVTGTGMYFEDCFKVYVQNIKIIATGGDGVLFYGVTFPFVLYGYFSSTGVSNSGIRVQYNGSAITNACYVTGGSTYGFSAYNAQLLVYNSQTTSTLPVYGILSYNASTVGTQGNTINGSTATQNTGAGGVIR